MKVQRVVSILLTLIPCCFLQNGDVALYDVLAVSKVSKQSTFWTLDRSGRLQKYKIAAHPQNFSPVSQSVQLTPVPKIGHVLASTRRVLVLDMAGWVMSYRPGSAPKQLSITPSIFAKNPICLSDDSDELAYLDKSGWVCTEDKKKLVKSDEGIMRLDKNVVVTWNRGKIVTTSRKTGKVLSRSAVAYQFAYGISEDDSIIVGRTIKSSSFEVAKLNRQLQLVSRLSVRKMVTSCAWIGTRVAVVESDGGWFSTSGRVAVYDVKTGSRVELRGSRGPTSVCWAPENRLFCYDNHECSILEPAEYPEKH
jgi:hypothetical protein